MSTQNTTSGFPELLRCAHATQVALIREWKHHTYFKDKNYLPQKGVLTEGIGLTGVLLMLVAFHEEPAVFSEEEKAEAGELIAASLRQLTDMTRSHFNASPILSEREGDFFYPGFEYVDSITYCLSSAILARYAERTCGLSLDEPTRAATYDMMARALSALLSSQRPDGTWGFATDPKAERSLYYTYSVSCSLADFFDYILGEINAVEKLDQQATEDADELHFPFADEEMLQLLDHTLGDTVKRIVAARRALRTYFVRDCLPLLPRLANCETLEEAQLVRLGILQPEIRYQRYHMLYFAYYLLDAMTISGADLYFDDLAGHAEQMEELKNYYTSNGLLSNTDLSYFFKSGNFPELYRSFYEQALHASRVQYIHASRTEKSFWTSSKSELRIPWIHEEEDITVSGEEAINGSQSQRAVHDPALIPLALRANTTYSYYVTEKPDLTIERLFENIRSNVFVPREGDSYTDDRVENLWDDQYYSLPVTEKAIEAIIDYYDYLRKFESPVLAEVQAPIQETVVSVPVAQKSEVDIAIEKKIAEYLQSEEGRRLIAAAAPATAPAPAAPATVAPTEIDEETLTELFKDLANDVLSSRTALDDIDADPKVAALVKLSRSLSIYTLKQELTLNTNDSIKKKEHFPTQSDYENYLNDQVIKYRQREQRLLWCLQRDVGNMTLEPADLYEYLIQMRSV